jgi:hypothetical protein
MESCEPRQVPIGAGAKWLALRRFAAILLRACDTVRVLRRRDRAASDTLSSFFAHVTSCE